MIRAILYDLDGVLVDACNWHYESLNRALKMIAGYEIPYDVHVAEFNGLPTKTKLGKLIDYGIITPSQVKPIWDAKQSFTEDVINETAQPYTEKIDLHEFTSSQRLMSACVTNSIRRTATLMLSKTWQLRYMKIIVTNEDVHNGKPSPDPYLFAMGRLGVLPSETLIVEDSDVGMASAVASGAVVRRVSGCYEVNKENVAKWLKGE